MRAGQPAFTCFHRQPANCHLILIYELYVWHIKMWIVVRTVREGVVA